MSERRVFGDAVAHSLGLHDAPMLAIRTLRASSVAATRISCGSKQFGHDGSTISLIGFKADAATSSRPRPHQRLVSGLSRVMAGIYEPAADTCRCAAAF
jgi:hypothetical protein